MIIIKMKGGLGNQMFQYALYLQLKALGKDVRMDDVNGFKDDEQRDPALFDAFGITYEAADEKDVERLRDASLSFLSRVRRKLTGRKSKDYFEPADGNFDPRVLDKSFDEAYLDGYWQSDRYFPDMGVIRQLQNEYSVEPAKAFRDSTAWERLKQIRTTESVSIHIRRGDYLWPGTVETFGNICTEQYYKDAVNYIRKYYPEAVFYIFSNDKEWAAQHFRGDRFITVDFDDMLHDTADLKLMSECKHHIIANSSFSWWAAWKNDTPDKIVIAPKTWINNRDMKDIYTDKMVRL